MIGSTVVYVGLVIAFIAFIAIVRPIGALGLTTRARSAGLLSGALVLAAVGLSVPARERRVARPVTRLDEFVPAYQFNEVHATRVDASPDEVFRAIRQVTASEIPLFQTLTWIRRFGRPGPENILNPPDRTPILDVATRTTFLTLAEEVPREVVVGTVVLAPAAWRRSEATTPEAFKALEQPGFAVAAMNFLLTPDASGGTRVTTETRVFATDEHSTRRFARYWRIIYPGSALIRRGWLRAIRRRAEAGS